MHEQNRTYCDGQAQSSVQILSGTFPQGLARDIDMLL